MEENDKHLLNVGKCYKQVTILNTEYYKLLDFRNGVYVIRMFSNVGKSINILECQLSFDGSLIEIQHKEYREALKEHLKRTGLLRDAGVE